jgi:hypothetical protein
VKAYFNDLTGSGRYVQKPCMGESKYMWKNVSSAMDFDDLLLKTK